MRLANSIKGTDFNNARCFANGDTNIINARGNITLVKSRSEPEVLKATKGLGEENVKSLRVPAKSVSSALKVLTQVG